MKKITLLLLFLLTFSFGYSQDLLLGFETGESGGVNGGPFGNAPAPMVEAGLGTNTTQVLKIVGNPAGEPWQGINLNLTSLVNLTNTQTMTMDVYSADPITFLVKVTGGTSSPAICAASATHTGGSTWQTVSFTFDTVLDGQGAPANGTYSGFVIHTYWATGATGFFNPTVPTPARTFYVDNIKGPLGTPPVVVAPTTASPAPPARPAADVKSIFCGRGTYDPIAVLNYAGVDGQPSNDNTYNTSWCPGTTSLVSIAGVDTNRTILSPCEGISFLNGRFDASTFTFLHIDIWTETPTQDKVLTLKLSNWNNTSGETSAIIIAATNAPPALLPAGSEGTWISMDIPLSSFVAASNPANLSRNDIVQIILEGSLGTIYYDNLYLHKGTILSNTNFDLTTFNVYPNPASNNINISSNNTIDNVKVYSILGQEILARAGNSNEMTLDISNLQKGVYIVKAEIEGQIKTTRVIKK